MFHWYLALRWRFGRQVVCSAAGCWRMNDELRAENAAMREIVQAVAGLDARQSEVWNEVGLFHDSVNVLFIREKARALLESEQKGGTAR